MAVGGVQIRKWVMGLAAAAAIGAVAAPAAQADTLLVVPGGGMSGNCTGSMGNPPCDFEYAVESQAGDGDTVSVAAGFYSETDAIVVAQQVTIAGAGSPQSWLDSSGGNALHLASSNVTLRGLRITHSGTFNALALGSTGAETGIVVERVSTTTTSAGAAACRAQAGVTIRDSVCRNAAVGGGAGVFFDSVVPSTLTLRNVTAYATENGLYAFAQGGDDQIVDARNSIFQGTSPEVDVESGTDLSAGVTMTVDLDFSSYASVLDPDATTSVTPAGTLGNISAAPAFTDTDTNFHQAAGSPTIDKGSAAFASSLDIDGEPRIHGSAPDIGADEFIPPAVAPPPAPTGAQRRCKTGFRLKKVKTKRGKKKKCVRKKRKRKR